MFCGNCGKDIGDSKVCPFCNPDLQSQNPAEEPAPAQPAVPEEEDNRTVLFSEPTAPQPEASLSGQPVDEDDSHTVLFSEPEAPQPEASLSGQPVDEDDSHTVLFSEPEASQPEASLSGQPVEEEDSHTVLFSGIAQEQNPYTPPMNNYPSYQPVQPAAPQNPVYPNQSYPNQGYPSQGVQYPAPAPNTNFGAPVTQEKPEKKSKKGLIIAIVAILVVLLAGGGVAAFFLTAPMRNYNKEMDLKDNGEYEQAIEIFTDLEDYEDSPAQITDCKYLNAKQMIDDANYAEAREILTELGDYKESKDELNRCNYLDAKQMLADGNYDDAKIAFQALGDYEDSEDLVKECDYGRANELLTDKKYAEAKKIYESLNGYSDSKDKIKQCDYNLAKSKVDSAPADAIELLEGLGDYEDSKTLLQQAKMSFCKKNKDSTNKTTYKYLKELKDAKYKGAAELYTELYTLKVTNVFWNTSTSDDNTKMTTIKQGQKAAVHFDLTGYTPDTYYFKVKLKARDASGATAEGEISGIYSRFAYGLSDASKGTLTVDIYDSEGKTKLYTATIEIV